MHYEPRRIVSGVDFYSIPGCRPKRGTWIKDEADVVRMQVEAVKSEAP